MTDLNYNSLTFIPERHGDPKTLETLRGLNLGKSDVILFEGFTARDFNDRELFKETEYSELLETTNVAGWDSITLCEKVAAMKKDMLERKTFGNDEEFDHLMQITIDERNKVLMRTVNLAVKHGFKRIVVVMGSAHYNEDIEKYCKNRNFINVEIIW